VIQRVRAGEFEVGSLFFGGATRPTSHPVILGAAESGISTRNGGFLADISIARMSQSGRLLIDYRQSSVRIFASIKIGCCALEL
jgi:hypothetical protein